MNYSLNELCDAVMELSRSICVRDRGAALGYKIQYVLFVLDMGLFAVIHGEKSSVRYFRQKFLVSFREDVTTDQNYVLHVSIEAYSFPELNLLSFYFYSL